MNQLSTSDSCKNERIPSTSTGALLMLLTAVITEAEDGGFIALNPETGTTTQGETFQEAIQNLKEATSLYLDEFPMTIHHHPVMTTFEVSRA